jgi:hypothetical protein
MQPNEVEARRLLIVATSLAIAVAGGLAAYMLAGEEEIPEGALTDPKQIFAAGKQVFDRGRFGVQACYDARWKEVPTLAGTWRVMFVVSRHGVPEDIKVEPQDEPDPALESCIADVVSEWGFPPLAEPHPMTKTYVLSPPPAP